MQLKTFCPFPVGYVYMSADGTSPGTLFPNTSWEQIRGKFLFASDATRSAGDTGGSEDVTLTTDQIPSHSHSVGAHAHGLNSHTHSVGAHKHQVPAHGHAHTIKATTPKFTHSITQPAFKLPNHRHKLSAGWQDGSGTDRLKFGQMNGDTNVDKGLGDVAYVQNPPELPACTRTTNVAVGDHAAAACTMSGSVTDKAAFDTNNSAAFDSGTPSTANTANSAAFNSGAAGGGRLTATCRRTSRSTCGRGSRRARRRSALPSKEVA